MASAESFQPWFGSPVGPPVVRHEAVARRPRPSIQPRAASAAGQSRSTRSGVAGPALVLAQQHQPQRAWRRPSRSRACGVSRPPRPARPCAARAGSCPAAASRRSSVSVAWSRARTDSVLPRDAGPDGQHLERGDDGVAAEQGVVPGDAGRDVALAGQRAGVDQQPQVGHAPPERTIGGGVGAGHGRGCRVPGAVRGLGSIAADRAQAWATRRWACAVRWRSRPTWPVIASRDGTPSDQFATRRDELDEKGSPEQVYHAEVAPHVNPGNHLVAGIRCRAALGSSRPGCASPHAVVEADGSREGDEVAAIAVG